MFGPLDLLVPPILLFCTVLTLPFTLLLLPVTGRAGDLASIAKIRNAWFKHLWAWFGPGSKPIFAPRVQPIVSQAKGVCIDVGPASGIWLKELGDVVRRGAITKIYGVEPNPNFQADLRKNAAKYGLEKVYQPIQAYVQDLEKFGVAKGSIDTIITVHVLCSVGDHSDQICKDLYDYLKPGGQWLVYEHVVARFAVTRAWQKLLNLSWPILLDQCELLRDTESVLRNAGEWAAVDLRPSPGDGWFQGLPHVEGKLIKAG
ncbi:hypothetical protein B0A48_10201 [Cryoendolithus antarcticus]|uniref:Methyltransferase type 11 domain-containing protein n=1 Tax=Cryoendolithus antarcticus TaxID=1507870 RepID=A0A1V8SWI1_9PEZI|nr:hypothetical protein B0A48_10201 [Cryoendolithus antarcticus]